jgi:hypothetical protein
MEAKGVYLNASEPQSDTAKIAHHVRQSFRAWRTTLSSTSTASGSAGGSTQPNTPPGA